ncbi:MAG TPA: transglycosylase SLT domain-containing protein [Xanthomonadales bacterium]|nr:transglycosylase SLT domain-containing protein [Xanthomonadales bacterium]
MFRTAVVSLAVLLAACAQAPSHPGVATRGKVDEAAVNAIYADVDRASRTADDAIARAVEGEGSDAAAVLATSRELLTAAAGRCMATAGCEIERVLLAQDALLERQARALTERETVDDPAVAKDAAPEAGTSAAGAAGAIPEAARSVALLKGRDLRQVITMNASVKAAIEEWLTWLRPNLLEAHENYQFLRHRMWPAYEQAGLPEALLFGILAKESGAKVHAVSRAGASGPLQFMYYTGARLGLGRDATGFDTRFDPAAAARANVAYLNEQFGTFNNSLELALGAYNGGEGRMGRLSKNGQRNFWDPAVFNQLPPETRDYVPMVLAAAWLFLHAEEYNLRFPAVDARPSTIQLVHAQSLNELAICLGQDGNDRGWFRTLRNLNPRYDPNVRIAPGTRLELPAAAAAAYGRHCVSGPLQLLSQELHDAQPPLAPPAARNVATTAGTHIVRKGETLGAIARRFGCRSVQPIATANRIKGPKYPIRPGQKLVVPSCHA